MARKHRCRVLLTRNREDVGLLMHTHYSARARFPRAVGLPRIETTRVSAGGRFRSWAITASGGARAPGLLAPPPLNGPETVEINS